MAFVTSCVPVVLRRRCAGAELGPHRARAAVCCRAEGAAGARAPSLSVAAAAAAAALAVISVEPSHAALLDLAAPRPSGLGVRAERYLGGCPPSPNCICSQENVYDSHYVPSWTYNQTAPNDTRPPKTMDEAINDLITVISMVEGEKPTIIESRDTNSELGKGHYVYAEFKTKLLGFVDDVEFLFNPDGKTVEYRSASRVGRDDLKANRNRIRGLRVALQDLDSRWASTGY